jgi:hypothetical protein
LSSSNTFEIEKPVAVMLILSWSFIQKDIVVSSAYWSVGMVKLNVVGLQVWFCEASPIIS